MRMRTREASPFSSVNPEPQIARIASDAFRMQGLHDVPLHNNLKARRNERKKIILCVSQRDTQPLGRCRTGNTPVSGLEHQAVERLHQVVAKWVNIDTLFKM
jgi:hypothetical protein